MLLMLCQGRTPPRSALQGFASSCCDWSPPGPNLLLPVPCTCMQMPPTFGSSSGQPRWCCCLAARCTAGAAPTACRLALLQLLDCLCPGAALGAGAGPSCTLGPSVVPVLRPPRPASLAPQVCRPLVPQPIPACVLQQCIARRPGGGHAPTGGSAEAACSSTGRGQPRQQQHSSQRKPRKRRRRLARCASEQQGTEHGKCAELHGELVSAACTSRPCTNLARRACFASSRTA